MISSLSAAAAGVPWSTIGHVLGAMVVAGIGALIG